MTGPARRRWTGGLCALALWAAAFSLGCLLLSEAEGSAGADARSVAARLLGSTRAAFSEVFYEKADEYFHGGVKHLHAEAFTNVFQRWAGVLHPHSHVHREDEGIREIMPWLRFSTEMDPGRVEAYLVAAYGMARGARRPDLAEAILREASRVNPGDYRIRADWGRLLMKREDWAGALAKFDAGIRLWPSGRPEADEEVRSDLAALLSFRGFVRLRQGLREEAREDFRAALDLAPWNQSLRERLAEIERDADTVAWSGPMMDQMFSAQRSTCEDHTH